MVLKIPITDYNSDGISKMDVARSVVYGHRLQARESNTQP